MTEDPAVNERDIFNAALEIADPAERTAYLEKVCAGDAALKEHFEHLLELEPTLGNFLEAPAFCRIAANGPPLHAGHFELGDELARGGMGIVYRARDDSLGRDVAIKVLHERYLADSQVGRRFLGEARITAQLQHPAIPPVFEVGRLSDDRPYLAMKLIKGRTLDELLRERATPAADRGRFLSVFQQVCQAVGYAHSRRILHRDLKTANVMVGAFGEVQVMDWGLAKLLEPGGGVAPDAAAATEVSAGTVIQTARESDSATETGSMLGTPAFMSPEQAGGELDKLDERTDVFGLGAVLCAILTGQPAYVGKSGEEVRLMAVRGSLADAHARLDQSGADAKLVELCRQCLAIDRDSRPRDAGAVAGALAAYLTGIEERARRAEVELAAAETKAAEQRKRRRVQLALAATVFALLGLVGFGLWWQQRVQAAAATVALSEADRNRRLLYSADVHVASQAWQSEEGTVSQCKELLLAHLPGPGQPDLREFTWRYQWRLLHRGSIVPLPVVPHVVGVDTGEHVVTLDAVGKVNAWRIGDRSAHEESTFTGGGVKGVTLSRNGEVAAVIDEEGSPRVFDVRAEVQKLRIRAPSGLVNLKLSADGRFLAGVGRDKHARVWETASGKELYDYPMIDATAKEIDLSLDGKQLLALSTSEGTLVILYRAGEQEPLVVNPQDYGFNHLHGALSPDGKLAAVASAGNSISFYDTTTRKWGRWLRTRSAVERVCFSPDGNQFAVGERTGLVTVWRLPRPFLLPNQPSAAQELGQIAAGQPQARNLKGHEAPIEALAFSADGRKLISISRDKTARCWDLSDQEESRVLERRQIDCLSYSPDGRYLIESSIHDGIRVHDLSSTDPPRSLSARPSRRAVFSPDGRTIAGGPDHGVVLWDAKTGDLAAAGHNGTVWLWDTSTWDEIGRYQEPAGPGYTGYGSILFLPGGQESEDWRPGGLLATGSRSGRIDLWDLRTGALTRQLHGHIALAAFMALSPDGRTLASASCDRSIKLWDTGTGRELRTLCREQGWMFAVAFSPDGNTLASGSWMLRLWEASSKETVAADLAELAWPSKTSHQP
jgi:WD40 repeat protein